MVENQDILGVIFGQLLFPAIHPQNMRLVQNHR